MRAGLCGVIFTASYLAASALAQGDTALTARELFYTPPNPPRLLETPAGRAKLRPATSAKPPLSTNVTARPTGQLEKEIVPSATTQAGPATTIKDPGELAFSRKSGGDLRQTAVNLDDEVGPPLALRYSVLKLAGDGFAEVAPDATFQPGDKIRLAVESNDDAYLYIVQRGASGDWTVLFPTNHVDDGSNRVARGRTYIIPGRDQFTFGRQPGNERFLLVLSRQPESDLERLIYSMGDQQLPAAPSRPKALAAGSRIDDAAVAAYRSAKIWNDLLVEKVDVDKPAPNGRAEKAMYVASRDRTGRAKIMAQLSLRHQ